MYVGHPAQVLIVYANYSVQPHVLYSQLELSFRLLLLLYLFLLPVVVSQELGSA